MHEQNPYAAPQATLEHSAEPLVLTGEVPYFADAYAFQRGAERAGSALGFAAILILVTIFFGFLNSIFRNQMFLNLAGIAVLLLSQQLCWRFYTGLSRMTAAARLEIETLLKRARLAFLIAWICYGIKFCIIFFHFHSGREVYFCCEVFDNLAAATMAICLGLTGLRLGQALHLSAMRRAAWLTMIFLAGSHLLFGISDAISITARTLEKHSFFIIWVDDAYLIMVGTAAFGFLIGFFSLMGLLSQLGRFPIRQYAHEETILDSATIERRRRMTEGQP